MTHNAQVFMAALATQVKRNDLRWKLRT